MSMTARFFHSLRKRLYCGNSFLNPSTFRTVSSSTKSADHHEQQQPEQKREAVKLSFSIMDVDSPLRPVIIMHGLLGSRSNWHSLAKSISKTANRKVIIVDARNHGNSPWHSDHTYAHLADDLHLLVDDLDLHSAVMVGHSMGGRAMMTLALTQPECVERLAVVDVSPVGLSPNFSEIQRYITAMKNMTLPQGVPMSQARLTADRELQSYVSDVSVRQFLLTNLVENGKGSISWKPNLEVLDKSVPYICDFPTYNTVYRGQTIFIGGGRSDYIKQEDHDEIRKLFPSAQFQTIPDAGHWVHAEKPQEFTDILVKFLLMTKT